MKKNKEKELQEMILEMILDVGMGEIYDRLSINSLYTIFKTLPQFLNSSSLTKNQVKEIISKIKNDIFGKDYQATLPSKLLIPAEVQAEKEQQKDIDHEGLLVFWIMLLTINARIWGIEAEIRRGEDCMLSGIDIARRTIEIRELNKVRNNIKKNYDYFVFK